MDSVYGHQPIGLCQKDEQRMHQIKDHLSKLLSSFWS